ncbi:MAG: hypothetical protein ACRC1I_20385, partial [Pseudomonas proteolytica]|uniref:hypothetical protein n=1 Tax=Pseudomonas proteolytica TaxID=219574 RepID=UPI003F412638
KNDTIIKEHRQSVVDALNSGEDVPSEVLKDYPDLATKSTNPFPADSIGAKITTPKSNIPLKTGETSKSETPNAVGAKSAEFGYKEAPTQNRFAENTFTEEEVANTPALENSHKVNPDAYVDRNAQERYDSDYEGEKADLFGSKQKWDDADTKLAIMILENETAKARKTGEWGEVAKLNKKYAAIGTTWGQEGRQRQRFANTPTEIISEAAETLFGENTRKLSDEDKNNIMKSISDSADKLDNIKQGDTASIIELIKSLNVVRKTTGLFGKETSAQMSGFLDYASKLPDGEAFLRDVAAQQIRNVASDYQKTSVLNAIKNYRVMGMLSKVATILRNLTANNISDPVESLSTNAGVPLDILLSKYTKTRSTSVDKSWLSSAKRKGSIDGFVKSAIQVGLDADVTNSSSKYETHSGRTFKMTGNPVERFLSTWAKWENYGLQSTDEFQKGGIAAETQRGIDQLKSKGLVAKDALTGRAEEVAKQRTFQNDGALATAMLKGRDALNVFGLKDKRGGSLGA